MNVLKAVCLLVVIMAGVVPPASAEGADDPFVILAGLPRDHLLEITLDDGSVHVGGLAGTRPDSVVLAPRDGAPEAVLPLDEIIRIRERRSNARRGAGWGAVSGSMVGGSLGFLSGLYLSSINDGRESDTGVVAGATAVGAVLGAGAFGLTGWGIGALTRSWRTIYGPEIDGGAGGDRARTRVALDLGYGSLERHDATFDGVAVRAGLRKQLSDRFEMGPHFEYVKLGGSLVRFAYGTAEYQDADDSFHASLGTRFHLVKEGLGPFVAAGSGWYWGNGGYLGGHVGGGLRYLNRSGTDFNLDGRYHFNLTDIDRGSDAGYWTLTAGIAF